MTQAASKGLVSIRRALLSVSDKRGVKELGRALHAHGCELIASGGTQRALEQASLPVTPVEQVSGNPAAFGGRMKTLSFAVASALLFHRERDQEEAARLDIQAIDLVVCNLYPFARAWGSGAELSAPLDKLPLTSLGAGKAELVELIDIGGPTLIRAAAKNFQWVAVVTDPDQYPRLIDELQASRGALDLDFRQSLMRAAFNHTADYDAVIAQAMDQLAGTPSLRLSFDGGRKLRYGENSHQRGWVYRQRGATRSLHDIQQLHGDELSYNNLVDLQAALEAVSEEEQSACAVVKHTNPCGLAVGSSQRRAIEAAWAGDPQAAFGSVIAFNRQLAADTVAFLDLDHSDKTRRKFIEVVVAPAVEPAALDVLKAHKRLRVLCFDPADLRAARVPGLEADRSFKPLAGSCLLQETDRQLYKSLDLVSEHQPTVDDQELIAFGLRAVRQVKSNAIVVVRRLTNETMQLLGMGAGQPSRVQAVHLTLEKCSQNLRAVYDGSPTELDNFIKQQLGRAVLISDAFFPFPDSIELAAAAGIRTVVQPGGSIRDKQVTRRASELGVALIMSGIRHFKH